MCEITNVLLYFIFSMHYGDQLDSCSVEYQLLQDIVTDYEDAKELQEQEEARQRSILFMERLLNLQERNR